VSFAADCARSFVRAAAIAPLCVAAGQAAAAALPTRGRRARLFGWALLLAPFLTPALLAGYAYSHVALSLVHHPRVNEMLYDALLWMKLTPLAVVALYLVPPPFSAEALHCRRLLAAGGGLRGRLAGAVFLAQGQFRGWAAAGALTFLLAFSEFEMASLMWIRGWPVALFDAHAGGLALGDSLRLAAVPALIEAAALAGAVALLVRTRPRMPGERGPLTALGQTVRCVGRAYMFVAVAAVTLVPLAVVLRGAAEGMAVVLGNFVLGRDVAASVLFGVAGGTCAYVAARWAVERAGRGGPILALALAAPGLLGPLVLSLLLVWAFQAPGLRALYDSPLPLALALALLLLPMGLLLAFVLRLLRPAAAEHAAALLRASTSTRVRGWGRRLLWHLRARRRFVVLFLLCCWGYFDLTASAVLAPPAMTPATVRLYNLMHYGRMATLSAMVCVVFCVPFLAFFAAEGAQRLSRRLTAHG
jgi:ABC-type Fe3+ transport system permease subunit